MNEHNQMHNNLSSGWNQEERKKIIKMILPMIETQKAYGRTLDLKLVMSGWEMILADKYNADQVCCALKKYALMKDDFPTPASINNILSPVKPDITQAEYIAAQDWQKRNGYPMFSDALDTINAYKTQEKEKRDNYNTAMNEISKLSRKTTEMIDAK